MQSCENCEMDQLIDWTKEGWIYHVINPYWYQTIGTLQCVVIPFQSICIFYCANLVIHPYKWFELYLILGIKQRVLEKPLRNITMFCWSLSVKLINRIGFGLDSHGSDPKWMWSMWILCFFCCSNFYYA